MFPDFTCFLILVHTLRAHNSFVVIEQKNREEEVLFTPVCDDSLKPFEGQVFKTLDDGVKFYREYATNVGFDTRLSSATRKKDVFTWRYVVCSRQGEKYVAPDHDMVGMDELSSKVRRRISSRCGCKAKVVFKYVAYMGYIVHMFVEQHNHELVTVQHRKFMKVNRNLDAFHQRFILDCAKSNIGPTASHRLLAELLGGIDFVGCSVMEVRNFSRDMKAFVDGCDAQMLLNEMKKRKELCDAFFYDFEIDADDKLTRLFWCDPISRRNYHLFGHGVAFDTTYSTNKYCMIFAPFTGKDNHGKPVTFAAGLLSMEDANSFVWLFQRFISCMGFAPKLIITDQDLGIKAAVERVLVGTRHRWCMWHIMLKVADKISKELREDEDFRKELNACVWSELIEPESFDASWGNIMQTYGLKGDPWFSFMFDNRQFWVPSYFQNFAMSRLLRTTSISECETSFYKRYTRSRSNLMEFWMHFNHALDAQRHHNARLNYLDKSLFPCLITDVDLEKHAATFYSAKIFRIVQEEIKAACFSCRIKCMPGSELHQVYQIVDSFDDVHEVVYDAVTYEYTCACKMFGRMGLLCRHIFAVLKNEGISSIPEKYIVGRWKKSHLISLVDGAELDKLHQYSTVDEVKRLTSKIMNSMYGWIQKIKTDIVKLSNLLAAIDDAGKKLTGEDSIYLGSDKRQMFQSFYGGNVPEKVDVHPPDVVKTKGSGRRLKSNQEKQRIVAKKPMRRCANCKQMGHHDSRNCHKIKKPDMSM